jgi:hypothetical protein
MENGDLYKTTANQERLVLGKTKSGDIIFATRSGNFVNEYGTCQIQTPERFSEEATFVKTVMASELERVRAKFASYLKQKEA